MGCDPAAPDLALHLECKKVEQSPRTNQGARIKHQFFLADNLREWQMSGAPLLLLIDYSGTRGAMAARVAGTPAGLPCWQERDP